MRTNDLLMAEEHRHLDEAKFNASWDFNSHLMGLIRISDINAIEDNWSAWYRSLVTLFRSAHAYMTDAEKKESEAMYNDCRKLCVDYEVYCKNYALTQRENGDVPFIPPIKFGHSLHKFDMFLKHALKVHDLLTPTKKGTGADAMQE